MKGTLRQIIKGIMDSYISFECVFIRLFKKSSKGQKRKVLILRKDVIGDFIIFIPTLKYYLEFFKNAEIHLVVNTVALPLASQFAFIDHVIPYDGTLFRSKFWYRRSFFHDLARQGFDTVVHAVYSREYICDRMVRATGAKDTTAYKAESGPMTTDRDYTKIIETPSNLDEPSRNMYFAKVVTGLPCVSHFPSLDIQLFNSKTANTLLDELQVTEKKYAVLLPGAGASYRTWQLEKFAQVADYLVEKYRLKVLLSGSKGDISITEKIYSLVIHKDSIHDIAGKTDIPNFAHVLHKSLFYFGSETGPMHLAVAIGTPVMVILGGGHLGRFFPYGNPETNRFVADPNATCRNDNWKCAKHLKPGEIAPCIRDISVESTIREIDALLAILHI